MSKEKIFKIVLAVSLILGAIAIVRSQWILVVVFVLIAVYSGIKLDIKPREYVNNIFLKKK